MEGGVGDAIAVCTNANEEVVQLIKNEPKHVSAAAVVDAEAHGDRRRADCMMTERKKCVLLLAVFSIAHGPSRSVAAEFEVQSSCSVRPGGWGIKTYLFISWGR